MDALAAKSDREEREKERVYELLDKLPAYWQYSDHEESFMRTMFEIASEMDEDFAHSANSVFLSENVLDSARGFRALTQGRFSHALQQIAEAAAFHANIRRSLNKINPEVFTTETPLLDKLDPYNVNEGGQTRSPTREAEARNTLAFDLCLASDVFCSESILLKSKDRAMDKGQNSGGIGDAADELTQAAGNLTLSQNEPPQVIFSHFKPVRREVPGPSDATKEKGGVGMDVDEGETEGVAVMPLGVRLLLADWDLGSDPRAYKYTDPYGVDDIPDQVSQFAQVQGHPKLQSRRPGLETITPATRPLQRSSPPTIIASKSQPMQPPVVGLSRSLTQTQTQTFSRQTQSQSQLEQASSQILMASTQVLPGPFGGRPGPTKKKLVKKRVGGF